MRHAIWATTVLVLAAPAAWAAHADYVQPERVRVLAHELEDAARHLHRSAEQARHHFDHAEERALRDLHELEDRARHFHRQTEKRYTSARHVERDFARLQRAFYRAAESMHGLHAYRHIRADFYRAERAMRELEYVFGGHGGHGRYDWRGHHRSRGHLHLPRFGFAWEWWR